MELAWFGHDITTEPDDGLFHLPGQICALWTNLSNEVSSLIEMIEPLVAVPIRTKQDPEIEANQCFALRIADLLCQRQRPPIGAGGRRISDRMLGAREMKQKLAGEPRTFDRFGDIYSATVMIE